MKRKTPIAILLSAALLYLAWVIFVCKVMQTSQPAAEPGTAKEIRLDRAADETADFAAPLGAGPAEPSDVPDPLAIQPETAAGTPSRNEPVRLAAALSPEGSDVTQLAPLPPVAATPPPPDPVPRPSEPRACLLSPVPADAGSVLGCVAVGEGWQREVRVVHRPPFDSEESDPAPTAEPPTAAPTPPAPVPAMPEMVPPPVAGAPGSGAAGRLVPRPVSANPILARPMPVAKTERPKPRTPPLTGIHPCELDNKYSLALPTPVREQLGRSLPRTLFLTAGPDACLWVYTADGLDRLAEQLERSRIDSESAQAFRRLYFAHTEPRAVDRNGGIAIPEHLARFAGLQREVVLIGVRDHFEIWDAQRWQQYLEQHLPAPK